MVFFSTQQCQHTFGHSKICQLYLFIGSPGDSIIEISEPLICEEKGLLRVKKFKVRQTVYFVKGLKVYKHLSIMKQKESMEYNSYQVFFKTYSLVVLLAIVFL